MKLTDYDVSQIKMMIIAGLAGKDIAKERNCDPSHISAIKRGDLHKSVKVEPFITISLPTGWVRFPRFSSSPCIVCGKVIWDGPDADSIYLVADDALMCAQKCERKLLEANR